MPGKSAPTCGPIGSTAEPELDKLVATRGWRSGSSAIVDAGDMPDVLKLTFADGTTEQIEVDRGRADQEFEDLRHRRGRYEEGWIIGESGSERWKWLHIGSIVSVEIHRESDADARAETGESNA